MKVKEKENQRKKRHKRVRKNVIGTSKKPRLNVYRSNMHLYAQCIDDIEDKVLLSLSTQNADFKKQHKRRSNKKAAKELGKMFAKIAQKNNIKKCVFDRGGYLYHGRVKAFAEGAREGGLEF